MLYHWVLILENIKRDVTFINGEILSVNYADFVTLCIYLILKIKL